MLEVLAFRRCELLLQVCDPEQKQSYLQHADSEGEVTNKLHSVDTVCPLDKDFMKLLPS